MTFVLIVDSTGIIGLNVGVFHVKSTDSKKISTSGHPNVDALIQETQLNATGFHDYLEWIPYEILQDVEPLAEGGFAKVYSAIWIDCKRRWNHLVRQSKEIKVALKCPHNQEDLGQFLGEISAFISCTKYSAANNYALGSNVMQCYDSL
ncbi:11051_t:CDS:2 [Acaulospora morrowiae]|uniref:11051_t:CDS:1 n=1 Tax=Acaulospora morrowiae TaxID=94023 RepID=A0A9N9I001_9GLOM|nr:11051_t:CDS:2 [Acaulospora morrowiae]